MPLLPEPLAIQLRKQFGSFSTEKLPSSQGSVWALALASGQRVAVKASNAAALERERTALGCLAGQQQGIPAVLHVLPGPPRALVLSWLRGRTGKLDPDTVGWAGAWLRSMHDLDAPPDSLGPAEIIRRRVDAWLQRALPWAHERSLASIDAAIDPAAFRDAARAWCHRDFTPSNWRVSDVTGTPRFSVLDFGQSRPDFAVVDLCKLWARTDFTPDLRTTLLASYGALDSTDVARVEQLVLLHGLQTFVWGCEHQDDHLREHGREILVRRGVAVERADADV